MEIWEAAGWGLAGGLAAGLVSLMTAITSAGFTWPWHGHPEQARPRLFVFGCGLALGALVAAATHDSMSGAWPAFIMGVGAPATIRGALAGVSVTERKPDSPAPVPSEGGEGSGGR